MMKKDKARYHHGNLAQSLLDAVDEIASSFGLEAVTLRACARLVGVSPSSAFRHYTDKRDLLTAFATRALNQLLDVMATAGTEAQRQGSNPFEAVGLAYIAFALEKPAFFRAMWREEAIYADDMAYRDAAERLSLRLKGGFASTLEDDDPARFSAEELLAWSSVHGLASLFVDGPVGNALTHKCRMELARDMLRAAIPAFTTARVAAP